MLVLVQRRRGLLDEPAEDAPDEEKDEDSGDNKDADNREHANRTPKKLTKLRFDHVIIIYCSECIRFYGT